MSKGEAARLEDWWGIGDEGSSSGKIKDMGRGDLDSRMRETMKRGVQRLCLLPVWWR